MESEKVQKQELKNIKSLLEKLYKEVYFTKNEAYRLESIVDTMVGSSPKKDNVGEECDKVYSTIGYIEELVNVLNYSNSIIYNHINTLEYHVKG